ncbi:MAG: ABC transporter substrate-binding protein [Alphaproteobacteria bacterium]|nr:ABC transporter substrate-binding protein [Alphaproteobacteria bacterium]
MSKKLLIIVGAVVIAAFAFFAMRPAYMSSDPRPVIRIGFSMPLSGEAAKFGRSAQHAVRLFFDDFDADAAHFRYEVFFEDNRFQSATAATSARKMIAANRVNAIVSFASHIGGAINPIAERAGVIHISTATDPNVAQGDYNFTIVTSAEDKAREVIRHLQNTGARTIDYVHEITSVQQIFLDVLRGELEGTGITVRNVHPVNRGERDFRPILHRVNNDAPDVIFAQFFMPEIAIFLRQYHQLNMTIPVISVESFSFLEDKSLAEGFYYGDGAPWSDDFIERFERLTGTRVTNYAEYYYAILQILTKAFEANPDTADNAAAARTILEKTGGMETAIGTITTAPSGVINSPGTLRKIENGITVIVK